MIGSFLNVVIYRLPIGKSVNEPRRSFCPLCQKPIPFYRNIPLLSWLLLRGKCADCGGRIPFRYFFVELLTGVLFLAVFLRCERADTFAPLLPLWVFVGLMISATFIDFDHFIIPDEITIGGTVAGLVAATAVPGLVGAETFWEGFLWSAAGAALGFGLLWGVVELGKLAFGRKKLTFDPPAPFTWSRTGDDATFAVGEESMLWSDIFSRESDRLLMQTREPRLDGQALGESTLRFHYNRLLLPGKEVALESVGEITGKVSEIVIPREAMGFGDVKFIACIGAFLGWKAVLFTVMAASVAGSLVGVLLLMARRRDASGRIPFGPYLALGALLWVFCGPEIVRWYQGLLAP